MTTIFIDDTSSPEARQFLELAKTLPFARVVEQSKDFQKAKEECNAISVDNFFDELEGRIERGYAKNCNF